MTGSVIDIRIIAKDMASSVLKNVKSNMSSLSDGVKGAAGNIVSHFGEAASKIPTAAGIITGAFAAVGAGIFKLAKDSGQFSSVQDSYTTMMEGIGVDSKQLVKNIKKATAGTVSEMSTMSNVLTATTLIGKEALGKDLGGTFERMAVVARKAARATGQDVDFMMDSLVKGVGRASPMILDNLGITVRATDVYDAYGKTIGKTGRELTIAEQKTALLNAVLEQGEEKYKDVAVSAGGINGAMQRLSATSEDLRKKLGQKLDPVFTPLINKVTEFADKIIGFIEVSDKGKLALDNLGFSGQILTNMMEGLKKKGDELKNGFDNLKEKLGELDERFGIKDKIEGFITLLSDNMDVVVDFAINLGVLSAVIAGIAIAMGVLSSPLTLAIALIGLVAAAMTIWQNDIGGVRTTVEEFGAVVKEKFEEIKGKFEELMETPAVQLFVNTMKELGRLIKEDLVVAWEALKKQFDIIKPKLVELWNNLQPILKIIGVIAGVIAGAFMIALGAIVRVITNNLKPAIEGAGIVFGFLLDWINSNIDNFEKLIDIIKKVINWIKQVKVPESVSNLFGKITGRATGGIVREPITLVGERGPELVSLPQGSRVHTATQTRQMMGSGDGINVVVNNYDTKVDENKLAGDILFKTRLAFNRI